MEVSLRVLADAERRFIATPIMNKDFLSATKEALQEIGLDLAYTEDAVRAVLRLASDSTINGITPPSALPPGSCVYHAMILPPLILPCSSTTSTRPIVSSVLSVIQVLSKITKKTKCRPVACYRAS